jgi:hypothetical protein
MAGKSNRKIATTKATEAATASKAKSAPAVKPATAKAPTAPKAKVAKAPTAPKARGLQGLVTITDPKFVFGAEGSARRASWDALAKLPAKDRTLAAFKAAGGRVKYLKRWQSAGVITIKGAA